MNKNFYQKHSLSTLERINAVEQIDLRANQPSFIHLKTVNQKTVAFLGSKPIEEEVLHGKFMRIDRMVIPQSARMINPHILLKQLNENSDHEAIETSHQDFFWCGKLDENVLLNVCGALSNSAFRDLHFHTCHDRKPSITFGLTVFPGGSCPSTHLTSYLGEDGSIRHEQVLFYITKEDIEYADKKIIAEFNKVHPNHEFPHNPIEQVLKDYFNKDYDKDRLPFKMEWQKMQGIFLIPMHFTDQRIVYFCIPNTLSDPNAINTTKTILKDWIGKVAEHSPDESLVFIEGDDANLIFIEEWCIFMGKDNKIRVLDKKDVYKKEVLEREIT